MNKISCVMLMLICLLASTVVSAQVFTVGTASVQSDLDRAKDVFIEPFEAWQRYFDAAVVPHEGMTGEENQLMKAMRERLAVDWFFLPAKGKQAQQLRGEKKRLFDERYGMRVEDAGVPAKFRMYEDLAQSFLVQMLDEAQIAVNQVRDVGVEGGVAQDVILATYRLLYYATVSYELFPDADLILLARAQETLDSMALEFSLDTDPVKKDVGRMIYTLAQELVENAEAGGRERPDNLIRDFFEKMRMVRDPSGDVILLGGDQAMSYPQMLWNYWPQLLSTAAISTLAGLLLYYKSQLGSMRGEVNKQALAATVAALAADALKQQLAQAYALAAGVQYQGRMEDIRLLLAQAAQE